MSSVKRPREALEPISLRTTPRARLALARRVAPVALNVGLIVLVVEGLRVLGLA